MWFCINLARHKSKTFRQKQACVCLNVVAIFVKDENSCKTGVYEFMLKIWKWTLGYFCYEK